MLVLECNSLKGVKRSECLPTIEVSVQLYKSMFDGKLCKSGRWGIWVQNLLTVEHNPACNLEHGSTVWHFNKGVWWTTIIPLMCSRWDGHWEVQSLLDLISVGSRFYICWLDPYGLITCLSFWSISLHYGCTFDWIIFLRYLNCFRKEVSRIPFRVTSYSPSDLH
jgi:hypothetical protein